MSEGDANGGLRVLLVDDDTVLRQALAQSFELAGIDVEAHGDPLAALAAITPDFPGMVVSDIRMPGIDGIELARRLKREEATAELPIILLTAKGEEDKRVLRHACHFTAHRNRAVMSPCGLNHHLQDVE